jgi:hypothetical protein
LKVKSKGPKFEKRKWKFANRGGGAAIPVALAAILTCVGQRSSKQKSVRKSLRLISGYVILTSMFRAYANWFSYRFWGFSPK